MSTSNDDWIFTLDLGVKCVGFSFGQKGSLIKWGKYVAKPGLGNAERLYKFSKWLASTVNGLPHKPSIVVIESPYMKNNVKTYGVLNQLMGTAFREIYRILNIEPLELPPSKIKNIVRPKKGKTYEERKKNMVDKINELYGLDLNYHKSNKQISDDDIADAIAIFEAYVKVNYDDIN